MDTTKVNTAIDTALAELNQLTDAAFKARRVEGLPNLTRAAKHLEDAQKFLDKAKKLTTPTVAASA